MSEMTPDDLADIEMQRVATRRAESWEPGPVYRGAPGDPPIPKSGRIIPERTDLELADRVLDLVEGRIYTIYTDVNRRWWIGSSARTELERFFRNLRREWGVS